MTYSAKEQEMFKALDMEYLNLIEHDLQPPVFYRILIEHVFINEITGAAVDSLRRCAKAIINGNPYRMTTEFDEMIRI